MTQIDHQRLRELFESVMDLPPIDRAAVLDAACAGNDAMRAELDSLLSHHDADVPVLADHQAGIGMKVATNWGIQRTTPRCRSESEPFASSESWVPAGWESSTKRNRSSRSAAEWR